MLEITEHKDHFAGLNKHTFHSTYVNKEAFWAIANHLNLKPTPIESTSRTEKMKRGKTQVETLTLNGWTVGDILEGDEGHGPDQLVITAIGEERFMCRWLDRRSSEWREESGSTTLTCREWRKVGESESRKGLEC